MALIITALEREFRYNGMTLADPNPGLSIADVQTAHANTYPELATAKPQVEQRATANGARQIVTFHVAAGTKG